MNFLTKIKNYFKKSESKDNILLLNIQNEIIEEAINDATEFYNKNENNMNAIEVEINRIKFYKPPWEYHRNVLKDKKRKLYHDNYVNYLETKYFNYHGG